MLRFNLNILGTGKRNNHGPLASAHTAARSAGNGYLSMPDSNSPLSKPGNGQRIAKCS